MADPSLVLRNRFAMVKGAWEDHLPGTPLPRDLGDGTPQAKLERLELRFADELLARADADNASELADVMWLLVKDRDDSDPVKQRVTAHHEQLARIGHQPFA